MEYKTKGVCARKIHFDVINNKVRNVTFEGGCNGNLKGIASLIEGMDKDEVIKKLENIKCGQKQTSCPDQLAKALQEI